MLLEVEKVRHASGEKLILQITILLLVPTSATPV